MIRTQLEDDDIKCMKNNNSSNDLNKGWGWDDDKEEENSSSVGRHTKKNGHNIDYDGDKNNIIILVVAVVAKMVSKPTVIGNEILVIKLHSHLCILF